MICAEINLVSAHIFCYLYTAFNQRFIFMKDVLKELEDIAKKLDTINTQMNDEERVWAEELADRKRQGLTGDAAVKHYNEWMDKHGMEHLKVPYLS